MKTVTEDIPTWLEAGVTIAGHTVEHELTHDPGPERRYAVRGPDGESATLSAARKPFAGRADRLRFRRLAARRAELDHPAAVSVRAVGAHRGHAVLITDEYPEYTLASLFESRGPLAPRRAVAMLAPVAEALDAAHAHRLVHRALDAESLLFARPDRLLLDTFGILHGQSDAAWTTAHVQDVRYRPPEQTRGEPLDPRANVYSLAALLVHALTGAPPFPGDHLATIYRHMSDPPPRLSERSAAFGVEVDDVVARALAKEREERQGSAGELLREMAEALRVRDVEIPVRPSPAPARPKLRLVSDRVRPIPRQLATSPARTRRWAVAAAVAVALLFGAVAGLALEPFGEEAPSAAVPSGATAWKQLGERRAELRAELAAARTPRAQAQAAAGLADLFERAARAGRSGARASAARDAALAYARLAAAARGNDRAAYVQGADAVERAEQRVALARPGG